MKVLVVGRGGREHALAWALARDPDVRRVFAAPGNPGMAEVATCVPLALDDFAGLAQLASDERIDLTVVGPEDPLAGGIVDVFRARGLRIFGPDKRAARIESSKSFAKQLFQQYNVPTPAWAAFDDVAQAVQALDRFGPPWVIKADGLTAGKGVAITADRAEAEAAIRRHLKRPPGRIVLEAFIDGWEATFMVTVAADKLCWHTPVFQDYKPAFEGDTGPNTGGMGVFTPVPTATERVKSRVRDEILQRTATALAACDSAFYGTLCLNGIVAYDTGDPYVLEFNSRFGDPEAQGLMPLVEGGLASHLSDIADQRVASGIPRVRECASVGVCVVTRGYPTDECYGDEITISRPPPEGVVLLHAGTTRRPGGSLVTAGGRVFNVVATSSTVRQARADVYDFLESGMHFSGMYYRRDIALEEARHRVLGPGAQVSTVA
jgi:phosphoribosylamine--glycine ligase